MPTRGWLPGAWAPDFVQLGAFRTGPAAKFGFINDVPRKATRVVEFRVAPRLTRTPIWRWRFAWAPGLTVCRNEIERTGRAADENFYAAEPSHETAFPRDLREALRGSTAAAWPRDIFGADFVEWFVGARRFEYARVRRGM